LRDATLTKRLFLCQPIANTLGEKKESFYCFNGTHITHKTGVAPTQCKKVERVEAMMLPFFIALMIQSLIQRTVRHSMSDNLIEVIPIYPEHRLA